MIGEELLTWPKVTMRRMFGMKAFYRGNAIFAMLPDKRAVERPNALAYKIMKKWNLFDLEDERAIPTALKSLAKAFEAADEHS
jgi:hypothetical protein